MKNLTLILTLIISLNAFSQSTESENEKKKKEFEEILNVQFSKVVTGTSFSNFGNFASVSTDDKSLSAAINIIENNRSILNIKASGGATGGISELFTKGELNSNIGLDISYHWINPFKPIKVSRKTSLRDKFNSEEEKIKEQYTIDSLEVSIYKELTFGKLTLIKSSNKIEKLKKAYKNAQTKSLTLKRDSLLYEIEKTKLEYKKLNKKVEILKKEKQELISDNTMTDIEKKKFLLESSLQKRDLALIELNDKRRASEVESVKFSWFSFGYGVRNDKFKYFDSSLDLSKQIMDTTYTSHNIRFAYSHYDWSSARKTDTYYSFGFNLGVTSDLKRLLKREVNDIRTVSEDPLREAIATQSVFEGDYKEDIKELTTFIDYYLFYGQRRTVAIHFKP